MFQRYDRLLIDLPEPEYSDPNGASAVQELLGGKFGEMSTLNNYLFQSFNFRNKRKFKPFYDLVSSITAEEIAHVELVAHTINLMTTNTTFPGNPDVTPLQNAKDLRYHHHFIDTAQTAKPADSHGRPWTGDNVFNSGSLLLDLIHNFFLECGARTHKMRVYQMTDHPTAQRMIGYLLVRGGVHVVAYARAIEVITGVDMTKMVPIPDLSNREFKVAREFEKEGIHTKLYTWSPTDFREINKIWKGTHPEDGSPLEVVIGSPEGAPKPDHEEVTEEFAPGISPEDYQKIVQRLMRSAGL